VACDVVAPTFVPTKAGDRVKTDRCDALKLARCHRAGELTPVWVPDADHEALRDLIRARETAKKDLLRARHRLSKFLLRHGRRQPERMKPWTKKYLEWVTRLAHFEQAALEATRTDYLHEVEHAAARIERLEKAIDQAIEKMPPPLRAVIEALQAQRGIAQITAATIVSEIGSFLRFEPRKLMGYSGLVASEHSSGHRNQRGSITKTGNSHLRPVIVEAVWAYQHRSQLSGYLLRRQRALKLSEEVKEIAWKRNNDYTPGTRS
jgi:transposase